MRRVSRSVVAAILAAGLVALAAPWGRAAGAPEPRVTAVFESRNAATGAPAAIVTGTRLTKLTEIRLRTPDDTLVASRSTGGIAESLRSATLLVLTLPADLALGDYRLQFVFGKGETESGFSRTTPDTNPRLAFTGSGNHLHVHGTGDDARIDHVDGGVPSASIFFNGFTGEAQAQIVLQTKETAGVLTPRMAVETNGDVNVYGKLTKGSGTFRIDHPLDPENRYLSHSFVESPEMMNVYSGTSTTGPDGRAVVELPGYFEALNRDFRYQLTVVGSFATAIVAEKVRENRFTIRTDHPGVEVCWQVTGVRKDPFAARHPVRVEEPKPARERGLYLHPEAYGLPPDRGIGAAARPAAAASGRGR